MSRNHACHSFSSNYGVRGIAEAAEPIRIGFMAPYVGVFTKIGTDLRDGFKLCLDEIKYNVAGREILFSNEDDEGKPEVGLVKARKLVEKDRIHVLSGIVSSAVAYAVKDYILASKVPYVGCNAGANRVEKKDGKYVNTVIDTISDVDQYWMPKK